MKIYDCFTFFNELDLLEMRLNILNNYVDYFVLVEATKTFSGKPKELYYLKNKEKFNKFSHKIIHITVDDMPEIKDNNRWELESFQRNAIIRGLTNCQSDDVILISDIDEIPDPEKFELMKDILLKRNTYHPPNFLKKFFKNCFFTSKNKFLKKISKISLSYFLVIFKTMCFYYYLNGYINSNWLGTSAVLYRNLVEIFNSKPQLIREISRSRFRLNIIKGGWHFSYLGTPESISLKIKSFAHSEYDNKYFTDVELIRKRIEKGKDIVERRGIKVKYIPIDNRWPKFILENLEKYRKFIKI
jgi:beta-1,4-mannosyl-glycoprotein beta-1,4-N-acetylglucosaminyltransferase